MVAANPLFRGTWTLKKFHATIIDDVWPEVLFFTLIAMMVTAINELTSHKVFISNQLLTVLGTVLGLVISFRTSSAYAGYQDGRKMWTNIMIGTRNLAQMIWIHVPHKHEKNTDKGTESTAKSTDDDNLKTLEGVIMKKSMINLIQAFSVSVKHFLRGEPGVYYQDLYPLISFLPRYASDARQDADMLPLWAACHDPTAAAAKPTGKIAEASATGKSSALLNEKGLLPIHRTVSDPTGLQGETLGRHAEPVNSSGHPSSSLSRKTSFDPEQVLPDIDAHRPLKPARNRPETTIYDYIPLFRLFRWIIHIVSKKTIGDAHMEARRRRKKLGTVESNVPLEITLVLSKYTAYVMTNTTIPPAIAVALTNNITLFQDTVANLERIRNTPIPFAYQAHLRISLWLYLLFLPFEIYSAFKWFTIPATAFAAFLYLGFLEIGQEIENPFGYDLNDLDLDGFCLQIQRELHEITAYTNLDPSMFIFSPHNQPFAPTDRRSAVDIVRAAGNHGLYNVPGGPGSGPAAHPSSFYIRPQDTSDAGMPSIKRTLVSNWKEVDNVTRK